MNIPNGREDELCEICRENILCEKNLSPTSTCEGSFCEEALPYLLELIEEERRKEKIELLKVF